MTPLLTFLQSKQLIIIASMDTEPWIAHVYYSVDEDFKLYFISNQETKHGKQFLKNPQIAFSIPWFNPNNHKDRKGVQGKGICRIAKNNEELEKGVQFHNKNFPEFADRVTLEWMKDPKNTTKVWVIEPSYIKFLNDELYGENGTKEFTF